jgi:hypothetical protein
MSAAGSSSSTLLRPTGGISLQSDRLLVHDVREHDREDVQRRDRERNRRQRRSSEDEQMSARVGPHEFEES